MTLLSDEQKNKFWEDGVLLVENAVSDNQLKSLRETFSSWLRESRNHTADYGETLDGRARFDLQPGHSVDKPALRRVQSPEEISDVYLDVMRSARTVDFCSELIGPAIRFHHGKVNSKQPGAATNIKWHQDFLFQPMTNNDMITCLLFVDDVTLENGPLEIIPRSHKGPLYSHWQNGVFTGSVANEIIEPHKDNIIKCTGRAGTVCLMHVNLLHASAPNMSDRPRTLYITTYYSEDSIELSQNHLPSKFTNEVVRGAVSGRVRCTAYEMQIPEVPKDTSFFAQQENSKI